MALIIDSVSKKYAKSLILDSVSLTVPERAVTGFVGPNGSGKTTTMRIMAGLVSPDSGSVLFDGRPLSSFGSPASVVGFVLDASAFHPGRTVRNTMRIQGMVSGVARQRADAMVERVGLASVAKRRVGQLSLGMRQRLAIGSALLAEPKYLVLDEPVNGLDVEGALWLREILRDHADSGGGVLLSSHLLRELDEIADEVVYLSQGRVVTSGEADSQVAALSVVRSANDAMLCAALNRGGLEAQVTADGLVCSGAREDIWRVSVQENIPLDVLAPRAKKSIEDTFLEITEGEFRSQGGVR